MNKTIAVDGPAGSGKSSIARLLAQKIGFSYFDTGLIYRAIAHHFIKEKISAKDEANIELKLPAIDLYVRDDKVYLNGEDVTPLLKSDEVNLEVANYAKIKAIRKYIQFIQKRFSAENNCVMDGRDIGSVVFPNSFCKFYLDADVEERSRRRFEELSKNGSEKSKSLEEIKKEIILRDHLDRTRKESPLKIPPDAMVIDSSNLNLNQVLTEMINHYNQQLELTNVGSGGSGGHQPFLKALDEFSWEKKSSRSRKILKGIVVKIENDEIILDIGEKTDGYIERDESKQLLSDSSIKVNQELEVVYLGTSARGVKVSKLIADKNRSKLLIEKAFVDKEIIKGKVAKVIKGGFIVNIDENLAFCPYSEFDVRNVNSEKQVGRVLDFNILENQGGKVVLSRKKIIQTTHEKNKREFYENVTEGMILNGKVIAFISLGALLEIEEGVVLLLKNEDISWKYVKNASHVLKKNQMLEVKVIGYDKENQRVRISRKELEVDPFISFSQVYKVGDIIKARVRRLESFGAFMVVSEGLDGLLHVSNISWYRKIEHPSQMLKKNQELEVKILKIEPSQRKISLGLREVDPNPWDAMEQTYPNGVLVLGRIFLLTKTGIYVLIDKKIEGFIHLSNTSFPSDADLRTKFKEDQEVFAIVKNIYKSKRRLELILKEESNDPWRDFGRAFRKETVVHGEVKGILDNGVSVEVFDGVVGFCHKSQISEDFEEEKFDIKKEVELGKRYSFKIQLFNQEKKILRLSRKEYLQDKNQKNFKQYLKDDKKTYTLSDFLKKDQ